ncbi:cation diffusion facilitator family transporter [candidate division KSB1 bacterium]|nr:cation diffusion facilitator family transporter [candidate division KSB1 bacterium]
MGKWNERIKLTLVSRLILTVLLNLIITLTEIIGGILSGSLALISDALHNFSDGVSVIISYLALRLRSRENSPRHTFGLKRAEIFAAVINSVVLLGISGYLFYQAFLRFFNPTTVAGELMSVIAFIGLVANLCGMLLLRRDARQSLNLKSAYLHLLSDTISSVGVLLGGIAISCWRIYWLDPLLTFVIGLYILKESFEILNQAIHILMEGAPTHISLKAIQDAIQALPEVQNLHHLHLWTVGEADIYLEGHVNINDMRISESQALRARIEQILHDTFQIQHITLQFECNQCPGVGLIVSKHARDNPDNSAA